jgi:methylmalonyl-CoA/ethylmalonyl-CoA epimerase
MKQGIVEANAIMQVAIVVRDIEKCHKCMRCFSVSLHRCGFTRIRRKKPKRYSVARPVRFGPNMLTFPLGQIQLELVEPDEHPSTWREHLDRYGEGLHHVAFRVDNMEKTVESMERLSMPVIQSGDFTGGTYTNMETFEQLKLPIELLAFQQSAEKNE